MSQDRARPPVGTESSELSTNSFELSSGWWIRVARVRLRFLIIVVVAGTVVGQWPVLRAVWDRWTWGTGHKSASGSVSSSHEYFCPMDPGVISVWPAICPICNMDLVPRKKMDAQMLPEGVIARMQLSPYRIQLAGIRTTVVGLRSLIYEQEFAGVLRQYDDGSLGFDANLSAADAPFFMKSHPAEVRAQMSSEPVAASVHLIEGTRIPRVRIVLDDARTLSNGIVVTAIVSLTESDTGEVLAIPESAVVDRGRERLVYVESMPGLFDGVAVELGRRCGSFYPVTKGLKSGQRVASAGAFLIDAETRLNPSLAAGYFGANQSESKAATAPPSTSIPTSLPLKKSTSPKRILSREDQVLADKQRICPVTELSLNSMGGPVPVMVAGRKVFICCSGCEQRLKDEPDKYLARIPFK